MRRRVVVTGLGLCTPLGVGVKRVWRRLLEGHSGIVSLPKTKEYASLPSQVVGRVPVGSGDGEFDEENWVTSAEKRTMGLPSVYALCAAEEALTDSSLEIPFVDPMSHKVGVCIGACVADLQEIITSGILVEEGKHHELSPYFALRYLSNLPAGYVSMRYNLKGPNHSPATSCATGLHAIGDAAVLISRGLCNVMVAGATETCIHPLAISGLCKTKALSTKYNSDPIKASRPFDSKRDGFVMSEGAGLVVLEELEHALSRRSKIYAEILGYGLSGNAYHVTAPSEKGVARSMLSALKDAHLSPKDIGHINAHATSTLLGDSAENAAIKLVFNDHSANMFISANKGSIGHLLRAAGSVEAIFTILAVNEGVAPPTINLDEKEDEFDLNYCESGPQEWRVTGEQRIRVALSNSFGFGGTNGTLCIGQYHKPNLK